MSGAKCGPMKSAKMIPEPRPATRRTMAHRRQGLIGIASCCLLLVLLQTITLAQGSSISGTGDPRFSRAQERQALQIICRNGYLEFMMNPCTNDRLDQPAERDKAVRLYGYAVGEIAARLDISKEQSLALIHSITNVDMAKRFATGKRLSCTRQRSAYQ
jgi:hypothetical protein